MCRVPLNGVVVGLLLTNITVIQCFRRTRFSVWVREGEETGHADLEWQDWDGSDKQSYHCMLATKWKNMPVALKCHMSMGQNQV